MLKALARNPRRRYESMRAFADDLRRFLNHQSVDAKAAGRGGTLSLRGMRDRPLVADGRLVRADRRVGWRRAGPAGSGRPPRGACARSRRAGRRSRRVWASSRARFDARRITSLQDDLIAIDDEFRTALAAAPLEFDSSVMRDEFRSRTLGVRIAARLIDGEYQQARDMHRFGASEGLLPADPAELIGRYELGGTLSVAMPEGFLGPIRVYPIDADDGLLDEEPILSVDDALDSNALLPGHYLVAVDDLDDATLPLRFPVSVLPGERVRVPGSTVAVRRSERHGVPSRRTRRSSCTSATT